MTQDIGKQCHTKCKGSAEAKPELFAIWPFVEKCTNSLEFDFSLEPVLPYLQPLCKGQSDLHTVPMLSSLRLIVTKHDSKPLARDSKALAILLAGLASCSSAHPCLPRLCSLLREPCFLCLSSDHPLPQVFPFPSGYALTFSSPSRPSSVQ